MAARRVRRTPSARIAAILAKPATDAEWIAPRFHDWLLGCCDCGLVHRVDFRLWKVGKIRRRRDGQLEYEKGRRLTAGEVFLELRAQRAPVMTRLARKQRGDEN